LTATAIYQNMNTQSEQASAPTVAKPKPNYLAPSFTLQQMNTKQSFSVGGVREKPVMINFWASWCGPCALEAPDLVKLYEKYGDKFDLYGVNITLGDNMKNIQAFVDKHKLNFPVLLDMSGEVTDLYQIQPIPTSFLVDKNGVIQDMFYTESFSTMERKLKKLIDAS
jgi:thiol-disulfide isomerase/thioredoxin